MSMLFSWVVWQDLAPLQTPRELGTVEAPTLAVAKNRAAQQWPGVPLLIQSAASHRARPVTAIPRQVPPPPRQQRGERRGLPTGYKARLRHYCDAKRAAARRDKA